LRRRRSVNAKRDVNSLAAIPMRDCAAGRECGRHPRRRHRATVQARIRSHVQLGVRRHRSVADVGTL
jgi:hypothetical protein